MTSPDSPLAALLAHQHRYPLSQVADLYKLLHQATLGSSHAVSKKKNMQEWLEYEFSHTPPSPAPFLTERVGNGWVRLHLRPYLAQGGQLAPMMKAITQSAQANQESPSALQGAWAEAMEALKGGQVKGEGLTLREMALFGTVQAARGWAVCPHSPAYLRAYQPTYFLLTLPQAEALCQSQSIALTWPTTATP